jgi:hypothetical protein
MRIATPLLEQLVIVGGLVWELSLSAVRWPSRYATIRHSSLMACVLKMLLCYASWPLVARGLSRTQVVRAVVMHNGRPSLGPIEIHTFVGSVRRAVVLSRAHTRVRAHNTTVVLVGNLNGFMSHEIHFPSR